MSVEHKKYKINPLKKYRLRLGLTQAEVADLAGITPQAVLKYEQGLYQEPSDNIIGVLHEHAQNNSLPVNWDIYKEYTEWRLLHQASKAWIFERNHTVAINGRESPFATFRKSLPTDYRSSANFVPAVGYTLQGFCVLLALHPHSVAKYDKGLVRHMPQMISEALRNAKCPVVTIKALEQYGAIYFDSISAKTNSN